MMAFRSDPEDLSRIIVPSGRRDEIVLAEQELNAMQSELSSMLQQKSRLAALGLAASKVNHDRATCCHPPISSPTGFRHCRIQPCSVCPEAHRQSRPRHRLPEPDLEVRPGAGAAATARETHAARPADEVIDAAVVQASSRIVLYNHVPAGIIVDADREQLSRVLTNIMRNAIQPSKATRNN